MQTKTISSIQNAQRLDATHGLVLAASACEGVKVLSIEGYCLGTASTQYFLQLHNAVAVPATNAIPLRSVQVLGLNGFTFEYRPSGLDTVNMTVPRNDGKLILVLSSTDNVFTAVADGATCDVQVDLEDAGLNDAATNVSTAGDLTTGVKKLEVWTNAQANASKKLFSVTAINGTGADGYLQLYPLSTAAVVDGITSQKTIWPVAAGATLTLDFGLGITAYGKSATTFAEQFGCTLAGSTTQLALTLPATSTWNIKATYK